METNDARKPRRKAKLAHVALIAGVSTTTASRALRGEGRVAPATVERVRTVAEVLGYQVNVTARALRRGDANRLLGILSDPRTQLANRTEADVSHTFWFRIFQSLGDQMSGAGVGMVSATIDTQHILDNLPLSAVLLVSTSTPRPTVDQFDFTVPIIALGSPEEGDDPRIRAYVRYDNVAMTNSVMDHLVERGATRVAMVTQSELGQHADETIAAFEAWCDRTGHECIVVSCRGDDEETTELVAQAVRDGCDGIYVYLPQSRSSLRGIEVAGKRFPDDVLVVVHSEGVVEAQMTPSVTVMSPLATENALTIGKVILDAMHRHDDSIHDMVAQFRLIEGDSTRR